MLGKTPTLGRNHFVLVLKCSGQGLAHGSSSVKIHTLFVLLKLLSSGDKNTNKLALATLTGSLASVFLRPEEVWGMSSLPTENGYLTLSKAKPSFQKLPA